jgi:uroporphyrinogen decarboxylase
MLSRERVIEVIQHRRPDRVPVYGWVAANLSDPIAARFGSVAAFEDEYEFDLAHLFGGPQGLTAETLAPVRAELGEVTPAALLELELLDVDNSAAYDSIRAQIEHHKVQRGRFVYVQTPGIFECLNGAFGIENHLLYLALYEEELHEVYARQAQWNRRFAENCLDLGADMIHVSDDWGSQAGLMFSPDTWWRLIYPYHKVTADAVKARGGFLSLHSDGNVSSVIDGIMDLGFDVVHPWQESAGMSLDLFRDRYRERFTVMGGLDVQTSIGFGNLDRLRHDIERVLSMFRDGGLLYCTSHFVQDHCGMDELVFAFDLIRDIVRDQQQNG